MNPHVAAGTILVLAAAVLSRPAAGQRRPQPIIDMHMHALAADEQGPPPLGMCTPFPEYAAWDPRTSYPELFLSKFKKPACPDPVWSPMTDDEVVNQTLAIADRHHMLGVFNNAARFLRLQP